MSDYTGELQGSLTLRITDKLNGPGQDETGTTTDLPFSFPVPCQGTPGGGGGSCSVDTTVDGVMAGAVVEGKRSNWELGQVEVLDGGADGLAATADNTLFARQGIFIP
jgi:hypothetical protein